MSSPDVTGARQRKADTTDGAESPNPASLSTNRSREVPRNKPVVKPPFADVTMGKFLTYLVFGLLSVAAFYTWRFTVWAADAGGYWNLVTGHRSSPTGAAVGLAGEAAMKAAGSAVSAASSARSSHTGSGKSKGSSGSGEPDIQGRIYDLANALGIKPADLSNAIRPLIDPSVPNPAEAAKQEADLLRAQLAGQGGAAKPAESAESHGSLLAALGEAVLD